MVAALSAAALVLSGLAAASASAETVWLCKPGLANNPCESSEETTVQLGNGSSFVEDPQPASNPPIDCFYVYPTVSSQLTVENGHLGNANLEIGPEEIQIAIDQASRFSQTCKVYAPIYPQLTLGQINTPGAVTPEGAEKAYLGVLSAWQEYLAKYNNGRGVVLIGHSQGALMLSQLIKEQIDPSLALRKQLVSALLLGGNVLVPKGKNVGGTFTNVPSCQVAGQTGCVLAYSSFLNEPPPGADFGRVNSPLLAGTLPELELMNDEVLCVNPTLLVQGANAGPLLRYESTSPFPGYLGTFFQAPKAPTPWVSMPGQYSGQCERAGGATWLQLTNVGPEGDPREPIKETLGPLWGTHLEDVNVALGNLVELIAIQSRVYLGGTPQVTSVTPTSGSTLGGTAVTIKGSGFLAGTTVKIGNAATAVHVASETEITATTATTAAGSDEVVVTDANGTSTGGPFYTYYASPPPTVVTGTASSLTQTSTSLNATVNPNGRQVSQCKFEYGTTTAYGSSTPCTPSPGSGQQQVPVSASLTGLTASTVYHFRVSAANVGGTSMGSDRKFTTAFPPGSGSSSGQSTCVAAKACHWYVGVTSVIKGSPAPEAEGTVIPTISWGTLSLESGAGTVTCRTATLGDDENPVGGGPGRSETDAFATAACEAPGCTPTLGLAPVITAEELPWGAELEESKVAPLTESSGGLRPVIRLRTYKAEGEEFGARGYGLSPVGAKMTTRCIFRPGYAGKDISPAFEREELERQEVGSYPAPAPGRPPTIDVPGEPISKCIGETAPRINVGLGPGPSMGVIDFDQGGKFRTGQLSCFGTKGEPFGKGTPEGELHSMGYNDQELINAF